ncbi:MAG: hypothetical protein IT428_31275 [Planctomycetaceae bacterium]|nr:hypothetical protein [Planctomycetaceae bacterium]
MSEHELQAIAELKDLAILDASDPAAAMLTSPFHACDIAEADNTVRLFELLHRDEYRPVCGIRTGTGAASQIRVYFRRIHVTSQV